MYRFRYAYLTCLTLIVLAALYVLANRTFDLAPDDRTAIVAIGAGAMGVLTSMSVHIFRERPEGKSDANGHGERISGDGPDSS